MLHKKHYPVILAFIIVLVSCSHQKKQEDVSAIYPAPGEMASRDNSIKELLNTSPFHDAYTASITQKFVVKQKTVTVLTGKKGWKVTVNPAALETEDGQPVNGNITVDMVELTTSEELFKSNAATMSNGQFLASGGSYFIEMQCNGKKLQLKKNRTIKMEFPQLKEEAMELFYGNRDVDGNMNWVKADAPLSFDNNRENRAIRTAYNPPFPDNESRKRYRSMFKLYDKLTDTVYYQDQLMSIEKLVHTLKANGIDKNIDTLLIPACDFYYGFEYDRTYTYDTITRYRIVSCADIEKDNAWREAEKKITAERDEANRRYNEQWWKQNDDGTLEGKLQRYYAPSSVRKLGWINCDRFYESPEMIDAPVELPNIFTNAEVKYFLIFKSVNGLMSGTLMKNDKQQFLLAGLPSGQKVTMVAFTKQNGKLYNCKEEFTISSGRTIRPSFTTISSGELTKMFGSHIRI